MIASTILALSLVCQSSPPVPRPYRPSQADRIYERNLKRRMANRAREEAEIEQEMQRLFEERERWERMLPYILEDQRQRLQRATDLERNMILQQALNPGAGVYYRRW